MTGLRDKSAGIAHAAALITGVGIANDDVRGEGIRPDGFTPVGGITRWGDAQDLIAARFPAGGHDHCRARDTSLDLDLVYVVAC